MAMVSGKKLVPAAALLAAAIAVMGALMLRPEVTPAYAGGCPNQNKCSGEPGVSGRLFQSGYLKGARRSAFGEDLGYERTTKNMVDLWMADDYNRRNILRSKFEDVGVGAAAGAPVASKPDSVFWTFTADMGFVRK